MDSDPSAVPVLGEPMEGMKQALIHEGLPEAEAQKIVLMVVSHLAAEDDSYSEVSISRRRRASLSRLWMNTLVTAGSTLLAFFTAFPLIRQLGDGGFSIAAALLTGALGLVAALAAYRLSSLRRTAKAVTIQVKVHSGRHRGRDRGGDDPALDLDEGDVGTFATAVGRVADRNYAIG